MKLQTQLIIILNLALSFSLSSQTLNQIFKGECKPEHYYTFSQFPELYLFLNDYQTCYCDENSSSIFLTDAGFCIQYYDSEIIAGKLTHAFVNGDSVVNLAPSRYFIYNSKNKLVYFIFTSNPFSTYESFVPYVAAYVYNLQGKLQYEIELWYGSPRKPLYSIKMILNRDYELENSYGLEYEVFSSDEVFETIKVNSIFYLKTGDLTLKEFFELEKMLEDSVFECGTVKDLHLGVFPKKFTLIDK